MKTRCSVLAGAALMMVSGCAAVQDSGADGDENPMPVVSGSDADGAAGIQPAQPSGAPEVSDVAKRRAPDAVGTVIGMTMGEDSVQVEFEPDVGYEYFEGTTFGIPFAAASAIDGETPIVLGDLQSGDRINVWTGACAESMPVQCEVQAVTAAS